MVDMAREEQLLDDTRTDIIVRYGFIGPIVLEIKLSSNGDLRSSKITTTKSYKNMKKYMDGYGADYGIFLIIHNTSFKKISMVKEAYAKIPNVWTTSLDCYTLAKLKEKKTTKPAKKTKAVKKNYKINPHLPTE